MQGLKSVICSWEVALSWKAPAIAFLLLLQIIGFKMSPFWDSLAYTEANNQFLKKSFLGESGYHTGEESSAVCRQITGDFISCHSLYLLSFLPKTSITSPPQKLQRDSKNSKEIQSMGMHQWFLVLVTFTF